MRWFFSLSAWVVVCGTLASVFSACTEERQSVIGKAEVFDGMLNRFPDFQTLLTVEELNTFVDTLSRQNPETVTLTQRAESENGYPIYEMTIGTGSHHALAYAFAEPDDAVGSMMLIYLATELTGNVLLERFIDFTWHLVLCADPENAAIGERWLEGPLTLTSYAEGAYIPPRSGRLDWMSANDTPSKAQQAMLSIISEVPIELVMGLRSTVFGGTSCVVSDDSPELYKLLNRAFNIDSIPRRGADDHVPIGAHYVAPGFYKFNLNAESGGAQQLMRVAKERHPDALAVAIEIPYLLDPRIVDHNLSDEVYVDVMRAAQSRYEETMDFIAEEYAAVVQDLSPVTAAWAAAVKDVIDNRMELRRIEETPRLATVAETIDAVIDYDAVALVNLGQLLHLLQDELANGKGIVPSAVDASIARVGRRFEALALQTEKALDYMVISIKRAAGLQMLVALYLADYIQENAQQ